MANSRQTIEARLRRLAGASPEAKERMAEANEEAVWSVRCRACGYAMRGSLDTIREGCPACKGGDDDERD